MEALRATIDGIMDDVTRVKADIILNKADIDLVAAESAAAADTFVKKTSNPDEANFEIMEPSLGLKGGPEASGSNLYLANNGFVRWGYGDFTPMVKKVVTFSCVITPRLNWELMQI